MPHTTAFARNQWYMERFNTPAALHSAATPIADTVSV